MKNTRLIIGITLIGGNILADSQPSTQEKLDYARKEFNSLVKELTDAQIEKIEIGNKLRNMPSTDAYQKYDAAKATLLESKESFEDYQNTALQFFGINPSQKTEFEEIINNPKYFFTSITADEVQEFAEQAYFAYILENEIKKPKSTEDYTEAAQKTDGEIKAIEQSIQKLESYLQEIQAGKNTSKETLTDIAKISHENQPDNNKSLPDTIKEVRDMSSIKLIQFIQSKITEFKNENKKLKKLLEVQVWAKPLQDFFKKHNLNLQAQGIIKRHGGKEISGFSGYDQKNNTLYISFAGTKSISDISSDIQGWKTEIQTEKGGKFLRNMKFHTGFANIFEEFWAENGATSIDVVKKLAQQNKREGKTLKIKTTGHSLGGALAMIFAAAVKEALKSEDQSQADNIEIASITFGAPSIISASTINIITERFQNPGTPNGNGNIVNIRNTGDIIPHAAFWLSMPGMTVTFELNTWSSRTGDFSPIPVINPHGINNYKSGANLIYNEIKEYIEAFKKAEQNIKEVQEILDNPGKYTANEFEKIMSKQIAALTDITKQKRKELDDFIKTNKKLLNDPALKNKLGKEKSDIMTEVTAQKTHLSSIQEELKKDPTNKALQDEESRVNTRIKTILYRLKEINNFFSIIGK